MYVALNIGIILSKFYINHSSDSVAIKTKMLLETMLIAPIIVLVSIFGLTWFFLFIGEQQVHTVIKIGMKPQRAQTAKD